jgi:3-hydroxybutyryl-CoA dehydrogenase
MEWLLSYALLKRRVPVQDQVFEETKQLAHRFGKTVCCSKDYPGFIINRVLMPMINEAFYALYEGVRWLNLGLPCEGVLV